MSLNSIVNELVVEDVQKSIKFYEDNFKFKIELTDGSPITWVQLEKDGIRIMLEDYNSVKSEIKNYPSKVSTSNLIKFEYTNIQEVEEIYNIVKRNNVSFFMDYTKTDYGKVEFGIYDVDKNMILISVIVN